MLNPLVIIGGHKYLVYIYLEEGEYIQIDSKAGTVKKITRTGEKIEAFDNRAKEDSVFMKINPGRNTVKWSGKFNFDVILFEERSQPRIV